MERRKLSLEDLAQQIQGDLPASFTPDSDGAKEVKVSDEVREAWANAHAHAAYHLGQASEAYKNYQEEHRGRRQKGRIEGLVDAANHVAEFVKHPEYTKMNPADEMAEGRLIGYLTQGILQRKQTQGSQLTQELMQEAEQEAIRRLHEYKESETPIHETLDYLREGLQASHMETAMKLPHKYLSQYQDDEAKQRELGALIAGTQKRTDPTRTITQTDFEKMSHQGVRAGIHQAQQFAERYITDTITQEHKKAYLQNKKAA